jgi:hypothetical protein
MAKNTGKTYTFNQLVTEGQRLGIKMALTSLGLDGEERDSIQFHKKPSIKVYPGVVVANAKVLLLESQLDYEVMATTGSVYAPGRGGAGPRPERRDDGTGGAWKRAAFGISKAALGIHGY